MIPNPVTALPGSTPMTLIHHLHPKPSPRPGRKKIYRFMNERWLISGGRNLGQFVGVDIEIGGDALDIVVILQFLDQLDYLLGNVTRDPDGILWSKRNFTGSDRNPRLLESIANTLIVLRRGGNLKSLGIVSRHVLGTGFQRQLEQLLLLYGSSFDGDDALFFEHPSHASGLAEIAVVTSEQVADFGDGTVAVVRQRLSYNCHPPRSIALIHHRFELISSQLTGALLDCPIDVIVGHGLGFGGSNRGAQARISLHVAATQPRGDGDLLD